MKIGRMSLAVEIDGKIKFVQLPNDRDEKELFLRMVQSALGGTIRTKDAPREFKFETI